MTTDTMERTEARRVILVAVEVPEDDAEETVTKLSAAVAGLGLEPVAPVGIATEFIGHLVKRAAEMAASGSELGEDYKRMRPGDWVGGRVEDAEGHHVFTVRKLADVIPGKFQDPPSLVFEDGVPDKGGVWRLPEDEREAALWALEPGDELAYWCDWARAHRGYRKSHKIKCEGEGQWHVARIVEVSRISDYWSTRQAPYFKVEGTNGILSADSSVLSPFVDDVKAGKVPQPETATS